MRKYLTYLLAGLVLPAAFLASCGQDRSGEYYALISTKTWMYNVMQQYYLFYEDIPTEDNLNFFQKPEQFLSSAASDKDKKNGVLFSHVDSVPAARIMSTALSFGIEGAVMRNDGGNYAVHVLYTQPNSPASEAGLKRGDWILAADDIKISSTNYLRYVMEPTQAYTFQVARTTEEGNPDTLNISMPSPRLVEEPSVYLTRNFQAGGKNVFYLMYNSFEMEDETDLRTKLAEGLAQSPTDIVLDLRYNPGGYVSTGVLLGTLLAPASALGQNCLNMVSNDKLNEMASYTFDASLLEGASSPSYNHLYVITTSSTASAAEMLINCLRPYLREKLIQVGENTFGKNVAQALYTSEDAPQLEFWLTTYYLNNSEGYSDYYTDGLVPDYTRAENLSGELGELGTEQDSLMIPVLYHLEHGSFPIDSQPETTMLSGRSRENTFGTTGKIIYHSVAQKPQRAKVKEAN